MVSCPFSHRHAGSGVPQYRSRESDQSMLFSSHLPNRPCLRWSGYQVTSSLAASTSSLRAVVRTYQELLA